MRYITPFVLEDLNKKMVFIVCTLFGILAAESLKNLEYGLWDLDKERGQNNFPNYASQLQATFARYQLPKTSK